MASKKISLEEGKQYLAYLLKVYKKFYEEHEPYLKLERLRTSNSDDDFYDRVSKDSNKYVGENSFSKSWLFKLTHSKSSKYRSFKIGYIDCFEKLLAYYTHEKYQATEAEKKSKHTELPKITLQDIKQLSFASKDPGNKSESETIEEFNPNTIPKISIFWQRISIGIILGIFFVVFIKKDSGFQNSVMGEEFTCEQINEYAYKTRIVVFEFKTSNQSDNGNYAKRMYQQIKKIKNRDSLNMEVLFCDKFKAHEGYFSVLKSKEFQDHLSQYNKKDLKVYVQYDDYSGNRTADEATNFEDFRRYSLHWRNLIYVPDTYSDKTFIFNNYHIIVQALSNKYSLGDNKKGIKYIEDVLLPKKLKEWDVELLNYAIRFSQSNVSDEIHYSFLNRAVLLDSTGSALFKRGKRKLYDNDPSSLDDLEKYFKHNSSFCKARTTYISALLYFNKELNKIEKLLNINELPKHCHSALEYGMLKATFFALKGEYQKAIELSLEQISFNDSEVFKYLLIQLYYLNKEYEKAIALLREMDSRADIFKAPLAKYYAIVYRKLGRNELALEKLIQYGGSEENYFLAANFYLEEKNYAMAREYNQKAISYPTRKIPLSFLNQRRFIHSKLGQKQYAIIDSLKIINEYDSEYFKKKKYIKDNTYFNVNNG